MTNYRIAAMLTVVNLVLLAGSMAQPVWSTTAAPVIRASAFELVDGAGTVRSRLEVKPGGDVLLQLFDQKGVIKVKLGAGEDGSGMYLADETTQSGVQIIARQAPMPDRKTTGITLTAGKGRARTIAP
jgi:hypothetical protein